MYVCVYMYIYILIMYVCLYYIFLKSLFFFFFFSPAPPTFPSCSYFSYITDLEPDNRLEEIALAIRPPILYRIVSFSLYIKFCFGAIKYICICTVLE